MTKTSLQKYARTLKSMAARVGSTVDGLVESVQSPVGGQADGGLSGAPQHLADLGTDAYSQELDSALLENESYLKTEVDAALGRIESGTYGACERCGKSIPAARLTALPYTRYCAACSEATNDGAAVNMNRGRPAVAFALGSNPDDTHAAGTPGGGAESGGLGGTNVGDGGPTRRLEAEAANGSTTKQRTRSRKRIAK
jgi:RNA polymerase-binding transcription factor DksA